MQTPRKKAHSHGAMRPLYVFLLAAALVGVCIGFYLGAKNKQQQAADQLAVQTAQEGTGEVNAQLFAKERSLLSAITITPRGGVTYTLTCQNDGLYDEEHGFQVNNATAEGMILAAVSFSYQEKLTESGFDYADQLDAMGLTEPYASVVVSFTDGENVSFRVGNKADNEEGYYFTWSGDDGIYLVGQDMATSFYALWEELYPISQPTIVPSLITEVSVSDLEENVLWALRASNANGSWLYTLTAPLALPVDEEEGAGVITLAGGMFLGAFQGTDTPELREALGFDENSRVLTITQQEGTVSGVTVGEGDTLLRLTVSSLVENELLTYAAYNGAIYRCSAYLLSPLVNTQYTSLLSYYPFGVTLSSLSSLVFTSEEGTVAYRVAFNEQVAENNELVKDDEGNVVFQTVVTKNDEIVPTDTFQNILDLLYNSRVTGKLGEDTPFDSTVAWTLTFTFQDGSTRVLTACPIDRLNLALLVNGTPLYYLSARNGIGEALLDNGSGS